MKGGFSWCLSTGLEVIKRHFSARLAAARFLFDGNTAFKVGGIQTLVKADASVAEVSAASILAKHSRDEMMIELAKNYAGYGFEKHKGYGVKAHIVAINKQGYCALHRKSFRLKGLEENLFFKA